jgi:hypothetical protein
MLANKIFPLSEVTQSRRNAAANRSARGKKSTLALNTSGKVGVNPPGTQKVR